MTSRVPRESVVDRDEVLERLGHLESFDVKMPGVEEVVDPLSAVVVGLKGPQSARCRRKEARSRAHLALSDFVVVMRKRKIDSTGVHVHLFSMDCARHHAALDVPSWTSRTPGRDPGRLSRLGRLPEPKVGGEALASVARQGACAMPDMSL